MECQNIHPAHLDHTSNQMSPEEFQKMLYTWFEEKGLVADLRSYLRLQMINKLRDTMVGKIERPLKTMSLTKQAFSLVIAEHLLKDGCLYTLSIFSTEMPVVANHLPFSPFDAVKYTENQWSFDEESVSNILELLGIAKGSNESLRITTCYYKNKESLLSCVIKLKLVGLPQTSPTVVNDDEDLKEFLNKILSSCPETLIAELVQKIRQKMDRENLKIKCGFDNVVHGLKNQMRTLINAEMLLKKENKHLKDELKQWRGVTDQVKVKEAALALEKERMRERWEEIAQVERALKDKPAECKAVHCGESCKKSFKAVDDLRKAMAGLQEVDRGKSLEIEKLNLKVSLLMKDLENARAKVEFLNSCLKQSNHILMEPAGGDNFVQVSDESSDNLTDEIIKQVHSRLRKLEVESDQLDVKFKKLQIIK